MSDSDERKQAINELHVNLVGGLLLTAIGAWLVGKATNLKIRGTHAEVSAVANAMLASRRFQDELSRPGATVQSVMERLGLKHASAAQFERILGVRFPL